MATEKDYLLFVAHNACFQSNSLLIPAKEFLAVRGAEWQMLKNACVPNEVLDGMAVNNVLYVRFEHVPLDKGWVQSPIDTPWLGAHHMLFCYAEHGADILQDVRDTWIELARSHVCTGFNSVHSYQQLLTESAAGRLKHRGHIVRIVDSILSIELDPGQMSYKPPPFHTTAELEEWWAKNQAQEDSNK